MRYYPIIFDGESVRAILAGNKTQTRRVVKPQPDFLHRTANLAACPYGVPGDRLWVREGWNCWLWDNIEDAPYEWSATTKSERTSSRWSDPQDITYAATDEPIDPDSEAPNWVSPIFMPRWASRITLEITDVRVEQVQRIRHDDCIAEGIAGDFEGHEISGLEHEYAARWDDINAKRGYPWSGNPWVWALTFKPIEVRESDCE